MKSCAWRTCAGFRSAVANPISARGRKTLEDAGLHYVHWGEELGGFREGDYEEHMKTDLFAGGLTALAERARLEKTAFLCAEKAPWKCHRRFIARALVERGFRVHHILDCDRVWDPEVALLPL